MEVDRGAPRGRLQLLEIAAESLHLEALPAAIETGDRRPARGRSDKIELRAIVVLPAPLGPHAAEDLGPLDRTS
ncbi:MAG: hypothetical protein LC808_04700, partial [Actinobacteria bacterium]|nr:hypothetical protein [Actinomycetota bacterium]